MNDDKIKEILDLGFSVEKLIRAGAGGLSFGEFSALFALLRTAGPYAKDAGLAMDQYLAMTPTQTMDVNNYAITHYGASPDSVDIFIKKWLKIVIDSHALISEFEALINRIKSA